jgi:RHS repeat-associated protein
METVDLYGLDIIAQQQTERLYYVHDGVGSVRQLLDSTGQLATNYAYDPFGVPLVGGEVYNPYQYTGEAWDPEVELLYLRARYYQPEVGRFVTKDPWLGDVWRPETLNRYQYVTNNPISRVDPTGRQEIEPTPEPTEREQEFFDWLEEFNERSRNPGPQVCDIPVTPERQALTQISAVNPGIGLVFQRTVVSPERPVSFWVLYAEFVEGFGFVPAVAGGVVKSGVQLTVRVYLNGAHVDVYDTYDTTNLWPLEQALEFGPTVYRSVVLATDRGEIGGPIRFTNVNRERPGFRIGPFTLGGGTAEPEPLANARPGERGRGRAYLWFTGDKGLPVAARINIGIPEVMTGMPSAAFGEAVSFGGEGSYQGLFGHLYPSH